MGEPRHAKSGRVENREVFAASFEVLQPFDRQQRAHGSALFPALAGAQALKILLRTDNHEAAVRRRFGATQLFGVPQRPF